MRRHFVWLLLALSVLFNVFFVAGYTKARAQAGEAPERGGSSGQLVAAALELDDAQRAVFDRLRASMEAESQSLRNIMELARQELAEELDRQEPDIERIRATFERIGRLQQQHRAAAFERFSTFMGCLSDEQCRKLGRRMGGPGLRGQGDRHRMLLQKFDADEDGRLSAEERAAAETFMEARRLERHQRYRELMERFDVNQDGRLDEQEREEARAWMRNNPPERRNGHPGPPES